MTLPRIVQHIDGMLFAKCNVCGTNFNVDDDLRVTMCSDVCRMKSKQEHSRKSKRELTAFREAFKATIGPCRRKEAPAARRILQQLMENIRHDDATSRILSEHPARSDAPDATAAEPDSGTKRDDACGWRSPLV